MAAVAEQKIAEGAIDPIYAAKIKTAQFYFQRILPRTGMHKQAILSGAANLMGIAEDEFILG